MTDTRRPRAPNTPRPAASKPTPARAPDAPTPRASDAPTPRVSDVKAPRVSDAPTPRAPDAPTPRVSDAPTLSAPDAPTLRASDAPTPHISDVKAPRASDAPTPRAPDATRDNPGAGDAAPAPARKAPAVRPKHAASLILWREGPAGPEALMGRRHRNLRFMPGVLVFPGGRVDRADHRAGAASELRPGPRRMLERSAPPGLARALAVAALRELHEESGLSIGEAGAPHLAPLAYLCRAITPPGRPIRFDARFLIAPAEAARGEISGSGELEEMRFFPIRALAGAALAPITRLILGEFEAWLAMSPARRARRPLIRYQGFDRRVPEGGG